MSGSPTNTPIHPEGPSAPQRPITFFLCLREVFSAPLLFALSASGVPWDKSFPVTEVYFPRL